jgi:hypothetical protein
MGTACTKTNVILYGKRTEYTFAPPANVKMSASEQNDIISYPFCVDDKVKAYGNFSGPRLRLNLYVEFLGEAIEIFGETSLQELLKANY